MIVEIVPAFEDNYLFIARARGSREVFVVDPGDAAPIRKHLEREGLELKTIFLTHHHADHIGGVTELVRATGCDVQGPAPALEFGGANPRVLSDGDELQGADARGRVLHLPGHTLNHLAFHWPSAGVLFCGDVVFGLGCGRLFEGTHEQAFASLARLKALPPETRIFCAHEYTETNVRFCEAHGFTPSGFAEHAARIRAFRRAGTPTVPLLLSEELRFNPFLTAPTVESFRERRELRNRFRG